MQNSVVTETIVFPTINLKETGKNILKIRKEKNITVKDMQVYFGFEQPQAIYKWQWGECLPSVDNLFALSILFNMTINQILVSNDWDNFLVDRKFLRISYQLKGTACQYAHGMGILSQKDATPGQRGNKVCLCLTFVHESVLSTLC